MTLNKNELEDRLKQGGQGTEMSRSNMLGTRDPRGRRGAQSQAEAPLSYSQGQFAVNTRGEVEMRLVSGKPLQAVAKVDPLAQAVIGPTTAEVQNINDKLDELIDAMKTANQMER